MPDPTILWPAPASPAWLSPTETHLDLLVDRRDADDVEGWSKRLALRTAEDQAARLLTLETIEPIEDPATESRIRDAIAFAETPPEILRIVCRLPDTNPPFGSRRVTVDDLVVDGRIVRARAVARRATDTGRLSIAQGSDLHISSIWNAIAEGIDRHAPELREQFHSPNQCVARFLSDVNEAARRGELDAVVLTGDLVDHVLPHQGNGTPQDNVDLLLELLGTLEVPAFAVAGNHDYRPNPWRPRLAGLEMVGIPNERASDILQETDLWDGWPVHYRDPDAFRTHDAEGQEGIQRFLSELTPALDQTYDLDGFRLVLLSTGRDIHLRPGEIEASRLPLLVRSFPGCWNHPDLEGFLPEQIRKIEDAAEDARGLALFFHAPLLNPPPGVEVDLPVDLVPSDDLNAAVRFEWSLWGTGLRRGVFFRNPGALLRTLAASGVPTASFSGHTHRPHALAFDPEALHLRSIPFGPVPEEAITLYTAPALGPYARLNPGEPGYLRLEFQDGALQAVAQISLPPGAE